MSTVRSVTVFGGTGFLGRRIVDVLLARNVTVRVAARHPARGDDGTGVDRRVPVQADLRDPHSVQAALEGADAAVNAVSLYVESRDATYQAIHVDGAGQLARAAAEAGLDRLLISRASAPTPDPPRPTSAPAAKARTRRARTFPARRSCGLALCSAPTTRS